MILELVSEVVRLRSELQPLPAGMMDAVAAGAMLRPQAWPALRQHYCVSMPGQLKAQLASPLFQTRLSGMPRLTAALHALFALAARAGLQCAEVFGAATPEELMQGTLGSLYSKCHFGQSMPMLYGQGELDTQLVGPLIHELSHFRTASPPAPANLHEALAAFIGSEAWPAQIDGPDAIPGCAFFAAVGGWLARSAGFDEALRVQAGVLDLRDLLGARCSEALRIYGFLPFLETGALHLLSDTFHPQRWWKLIDLHRDDALAGELSGRFVEPALQGSPPPQAAWDAWLDALPWRSLPAFAEAPRSIDHQLAQRARQALHVRAFREGLTFRARRVPAALTLDREQCLLRSDLEGPDAIGAPPEHPYPPALCRE